MKVQTYAVVSRQAVESYGVLEKTHHGSYHTMGAACAVLDLMAPGYAEIVIEDCGEALGDFDTSMIGDYYERAIEGYVENREATAIRQFVGVFEAVPEGEGSAFGEGKHVYEDDHGLFWVFLVG